MECPQDLTKSRRKLKVTVRCEVCVNQAFGSYYFVSATVPSESIKTFWRLNFSWWYHFTIRHHSVARGSTTALKYVDTPVAELKTIKFAGFQGRFFPLTTLLSWFDSLWHFLSGICERGNVSDSSYQFNAEEEWNNLENERCWCWMVGVCERAAKLG